MKIAIVIPNYNGSQLLQQNIPKVIAWTKNYDAEIIVVDDASTDDSVAMLQRFSEVTVVVLEKNGRFAKAVNAGVAATKAEFVYLLNSDAYPESDFLKYLLPHFADPTVFAVGSKSKGSYAVGKFQNGAFFHKEAEQMPKKAHVTLWASGGMALFRRSVYMELGGMDSLYAPFYWEDIDLSYRAWKRGYTVLWEPRSEIIHTPETTNKTYFTARFKDAISERNQLLFIWKNIFLPGVVWQNGWYISKRLVRQPSYVKIVWSALVKLPEVMKKRQIEKRAMKRTDTEIAQQFQTDF